ncbi:ribose transport system permease protein [Fontibacillus phaseoli]|uniref:Ribose transport system permease protein n=1 Tax=Fontibacillus phaseoli TaxID=1416533 RepID=A0A369BPK3_9BACL|nr:ribose ABC transporter permease [Fontibacillus phaseoli]RCX23552.1 ribose transport system permease protein [Fontibacillus phaseoli]
MTNNAQFWMFARKYGMLIVLILFITVLAFISPQFFTTSNFLNIGRQVSLNAILAAGMTIIIISGGIDLSIGGLVALTSCLCAAMLADGHSIFIAIGLAVLVGAAGGFANGFVIAKTNIAPFIITLAALSVFKGVTLLFTNARPIPIDNDTFGQLGQGYLGKIPYPILIMLAIFFIVYLVLKKTKLGRYVYAIGGNEKSAILAGINVPRIKMIVYSLSGIAAALTGVLYASRLLSGVPNLGTGFELTAITAVVLGGTSFTGGQGGVWGTLIGVIILGVMGNALNLLGISAFYQDIVTGFVVLLAVLFDRFIYTRLATN